MRKDMEAAKRTAERRLNENEADRLGEVVPKLKSLKLEVEERDPTNVSNNVSYARHIVVGRAPALFVLPCTDRKCDGGHDFTSSILGALHKQKESFKGQDACGGQAKEGPCPREMLFVATATYGD
jgi:hypothetical protein